MNFEDLIFLFKSDVSNRGICRLDLDEAALLYKTVKKINPKNAIEIGRADGGSTLLIAAAMQEGSTLYSIDKRPFTKTETEYWLKKQQCKVMILTCKSNEIKWDERGRPTEIDLLFVDGDHSYDAAKYDHEYFGSFVRQGGYIIHHDMGHSRHNALFDIRLMQLKDDILCSRNFKMEATAGSLVVFEKL